MKKMIFRRGLITIIFLFITGFSTQCASRTIYVKTAPPAVRVTVKPARPFAKAVWMAGHWAWRGKKYVWVSGKWVKPRSGYVYVPGQWVKKRRGWVWVGGHWKKR